MIFDRHLRRPTWVFALTLAWSFGLGQARAQDSAAATQPSEEILEYMVPEMKGRGLSLSDGPRPYRNRLSFSPAFGSLGSEPYYLLRLAYNPTRFLGYEANLGHNPAQSVHSLVHSLNAILRWPFSGRLQPYLTAGYGMMLIFPGRVFQADPVTANQIAAGAGLEIYLREDVSLRGEIRGNRLLDGQSSRVVSGRNYREFSFGLSFYRNLGP